VRLSVSAPCLSLFAVAHCGSITGNREVIGSSFGLGPTNAHLASA
jgi:hypothetical protein